MKLSQVKSYIHNITYKPNWSFIVKADDKGIFVQVSVVDSIDTVTKLPCSLKGGKRYISKFMCRQELVGVVYSLIEAAEIHEMREWFRFKGASIYNPHLDPEELAILAGKKSSFNCRQDAMSMVE